MSATFTEESFTATGDATGKPKCHKALVRVSGTFSGTVKLKWVDEGGTTHVVQEDGADLAFTAPGERVIDMGVPVTMFWSCTAYTSGTIVCSITGSRVSNY